MGDIKVAQTPVSKIKYFFSRIKSWLSWQIEKLKPSNARKKAEEEFDILETHVKDAVIVPYRKEILALVGKFGKSGQSGGSAPITARVISQAVETLCLHKLLYGIMNIDGEWIQHAHNSFQNKRLSSVFKEGKDGRPYYLDAVVFRGQSGSQFTSHGSVLMADGSPIVSRHYIKEFPFKPKTFYIDVIETEWADKNEAVKKKGGGWWASVLKDESQLKEVFEFYDRYKD